MPKPYFKKCFSCFSGYRKCKKKRLPRKIKKDYKGFLVKIHGLTFSYWFFDQPTSCDLSDFYKYDKKRLFTRDLLLKYPKAIELIKIYCEVNCEEIYFDQEGKLSWFWEDDNGLYTFDGVMPFCYKSDDAGDSWAFDSLYDLVDYCTGYADKFIFPTEIVSDKTLLQYLNKLEVQDDRK